MASQQRKGAALDLMIRARGILDADEDAVVSISEHDCGGPECGSARTVILIMRPDQPTKAIKINKPLEAVTAGDLSGALASKSVETLRNKEEATPYRLRAATEILDRALGRPAQAIDIEFILKQRLTELSVDELRLLEERLIAVWPPPLLVNGTMKS